jgi:hypothetical protein
MLLLIAGPPPPAADSLGQYLETGCAGGVTGGGNGALVTRNGRFFTWSQPGPRAAERTLTLVRTDSVRAATLFRLAKAGGIQRIAFSEPANMTCFLSWIQTGGTAHSVAWPYGAKPRRLGRLLAVADSIGRGASVR